MRTPMSTWLVIGVLLAATSACGADAPGTATDRPSQEATTPPSPTGSSTTGSPTLQPPEGPPSQASDTFKEVTVSGTITAVDPACVVLTADTGVTWSLLGELARGLEVAQSVTVTGMAIPVVESQASSCAGTPLGVTVVR